MNSFDITEFVLWKKESGNFTGYAKYFGLKQYPVILKKQSKCYVVLVKVNDKWEKIGVFFMYEKPTTIRGRKLYKCVGEIRIGKSTYHVVEESNGMYLGF